MLRFLLLSFVLSPSLSQLSNDGHSLLEFQKGIQSDPSGLVTSSWAVTTPLSSWHGVTCDPAGSSVLSVDLSNLNLTGDLKFQTLTLASSLQALTLSGNNFTGRLVPVIGSIRSLQRLDLSNNNFYGPIPARIADLSNLIHLNLSSNNFEGGFPIGIQNLQQLRVLDLRSNNLWGDVKVLMGEMRNVEYIDLSENRFFGEIFFDDGSFSSLGNTVKYMNFSGNRIGGGIGKTVGLFRNLEVLDLGRNKMSGELPELGSMSNLKFLRVGSNFLSGLMPEGLFLSGMQLEEIDLSGNGFTGSVHSINSTNLKILNLSSNALSGSLPSNIGSCTTVDLSRNQLSGDLSMMQNWGGALEIVDLSSNILSGNYPNMTSQFGNLISIKLQNNSITGSLPSVLGRFPRLSAVDFSLNNLSGPILPSLFTSLMLISLNLSGNQFTGTIPMQSSHSTKSLVLPSCPHLETLDLSDNLLTGPLPPDIGKLEKLKLLNLRNNGLSGALPNEISKLEGLDSIDLSGNRFSGTIPDMPVSGLEVFNVSYNDLSGTIPESLTVFPTSSFYPGNTLLVFPGNTPAGKNHTGVIDNAGKEKPSKSNIRISYILGSFGAALLIVLMLVAFYKLRSQEICGRSEYKDRATGRDVKLGRVAPPNTFRSQKDGPLQPSVSFSNDQLLTSASRSLSAHKELSADIVEYGYSARHKSSPDSPRSSSPRFIDPRILEQPVLLDVYSPDRLVGEFFFLDGSLIFTAEELSRAPAAVLGRSSHGTSYKATLENGYVLNVKRLRVGLVKHKKEFAKEAKRIGTIRHPNIVHWRGYYWGPREQERLIVSDYVHGESLALYLYESMPRRYSRLSVSQRLKIAIDVARCLHHLHQERTLPHGDLKPTNVLLTGPDLCARVTDHGLHRLLTPSGIAEQILNLGALGYGAPELAGTARPLPTFKADVYAFGVILMELLTRRSAGDIMSGQAGAVDLTDWVQMCTREGRGSDCFDREIAGLEEAPRAMDELLAVSLKCILPVNERPTIKIVLDDLRSITL